MTKVHGKRYAYKFDFHGLMAACQQQAQGSDPTASMLSAASYSRHGIHEAQASMYSSVPSTLSIPLIPPVSTAIPVTNSITTQSQSTSSTVIKPSVTNPASSSIFTPPYTTSYWPY